MLKKLSLALLLIFIFSCFTTVYAQDKTAKDKDKKVVKDDKFANSVWKKINKVTRAQRSFKTEKATTVAGVRGDEAEDTALKQLYYKGGGKYPTRLELKNAIEILETSIKQEPDAETVPETKYYIGQCYEKLGENKRAIRLYEEIVDLYPKSKYAVDSRTSLNALTKTVKK